MEDAQFPISMSWKKLACTCLRWDVFKLRRFYCLTIIERDFKGVGGS